MKTVFWLPPCCALMFMLNGCTNQPPGSGVGPGTGPFDANGNYVEKWADDPSKWRKPTSQQPMMANDDPPVIASNEQPPPNANPLSPAKISTPKTVAQTSTPVVRKPTPKPKAKATRHVVKKGDTLSGIASRYGSSVSKIRSANGISGSLIRPGQSLVIPKR